MEFILRSSCQSLHRMMQVVSEATLSLKGPKDVEVQHQPNVTSVICCIYKLYCFPIQRWDLRLEALEPWWRVAVQERASSCLDC